MGATRRADRKPTARVRGRAAWVLTTVTVGVAAMIGIGVTWAGSGESADPGLSSATGAVERPADDPDANVPTATEAPPADEPRNHLPLVIPPRATEPSEPSAGRLVVAFSAEDVAGDAVTVTATSVSVYRDGRIVWSSGSCDERRGCDPLVVAEGANEPYTGWLEQRLTRDGVELLRSELLASGLFEHDFLVSSPGDLVEYFNVQVPRGGRTVSVDTQPAVHWWPEAPSRAQARKLEHLQTVLLDLNSWLPARAWAEREVHAFIPSSYCMWFTPDLPPHPSHLPAPADDLVSGKVTNLSMNEARAVVDGFEAAGVSRSPNFRHAGIVFPVAFREGRVATRLILEPSLPDRRTTC